MKLTDLIKQTLHDKRKQGKTSGMWRYVGIPYMVKMGERNKLYDWEKEWFDSKVGIRWDIKGNHLGKKKDIQFKN